MSEICYRRSQMSGTNYRRSQMSDTYYRRSQMSGTNYRRSQMSETNYRRSQMSDTYHRCSQSIKEVWAGHILQTFQAMLINNTMRVCEFSNNLVDADLHAHTHTARERTPTTIPTRRVAMVTISAQLTQYARHR